MATKKETPKKTEEKPKSTKPKEEKKEQVEEKALVKEEENITTEQLEKVKEEIKKSKKESKAEAKKREVRKDILRNLLIATVITVYFIFINLGVKNIPVTEYIMDLKTFSIFAVIIAIITFEKAYKKDSGALAIHGIEVIVLAIETMVILNLYSNEYQYFYYVLLGITIAMMVYYLIKCLIIKFTAKKAKK